MSLERAYINCERCYALGKTIMDNRFWKSPFSTKDPKSLLYPSDQVYTARNNTMIAIEERHATSLLIKCLECDHLSPSICNEIKKMLEFSK